MKDKKLVMPASIGADGNDVTTWALPEGAIARLGRGSVDNVAFSPDGQYFAVGSLVGLWLYELPTLTPIALWDTERGMTGGCQFFTRWQPDCHVHFWRERKDMGY